MASAGFFSRTGQMVSREARLEWARHGGCEGAAIPSFQLGRRGSAVSSPSGFRGARPQRVQGRSPGANIFLYNLWPDFRDGAFYALTLFKLSRGKCPLPMFVGVHDSTSLNRKCTLSVLIGLQLQEKYPMYYATICCRRFDLLWICCTACCTANKWSLGFSTCGHHVIYSVAS